MNNNKLKQIQLSYLINLVDLQLAYNEFESIVKFNSSKLRFIILKFNKIKRLESNAFNGLLNLRKINLLNNSINEIDSNTFNNSYFKELVLTIPNMSIELMHKLNHSLNPNFKYKSWIFEFHDSIFLENRVDIDCFKVYFFIKFKVFYNFINENSDIINFDSNDCMNLTKVRYSLNQFDDTFHHVNYIPPVKEQINLLSLFIEKKLFML